MRNSAGSGNLAAFPLLSSSAHRRPGEALRGTAKPELLVSANPGCTLQIAMIMRERGVHIPTAHVVEVLDASIRGATLPSSWVAKTTKDLRMRRRCHSEILRCAQD